MIIPVRCFSCGFPVGAFYEEFRRRVDKGEDPGKVLDDLGIERYCCRRMMMGQADLVDRIAPYKK